MLLLIMSAARAFLISPSHTTNEHRHSSSISQSSSSSTLLLETNSIPGVGIYIHIPFCRRRCRYCDFAIVPVGSEERAGFAQLNDQYTAALLHEIMHHNPSSSSSSSLQISSIYFGGGTPSLAPIATLQAILEKIYEHFNVADDSEITIEMDPGTFDQEKAKALRAMGFNRISLGVQSFNDTILESLGRVHRETDVMHALESLESVWGDDLNYSMDLISGLPGLSVAEWANTLERAVYLKPRPKHLSLYDLQVERVSVLIFEFRMMQSRVNLSRSCNCVLQQQGTVFGRWYSESIPLSPASALPLPSDEDASFMYKYASGYLRWHGYEHYEVSSYAVPGHKSQHNQEYWAVDGQWYAFGLGATSHVNGQLMVRPRTMVDYLKWVQNASVSLLTLPSLEDRLLDLVLKRLRTSEGLDLNWICHEFGSQYENAIRRGAALGIELGMATVDERGVLKLTDPRGLLYSNSIISTIFAELENLPEWTVSVSN